MDRRNFITILTGSAALLALAKTGSATDTKSNIDEIVDYLYSKTANQTHLCVMATPKELRRIAVAVAEKEKSFYRYNATKELLQSQYGQYIYLTDINEPDRLRGANFNHAVVVGTSKYSETLGMLNLCMRIGTHPTIKHFDNLKI
jgi:hypothetical protein